MRAVDWLARTLMLVLAALATLALIGSLASVSQSPIGAVFPGGIAEPIPPTMPAEDRATESSPVPGEASAMSSETVAMDVREADRIAAADRHELARWLKALVYAILALTAVAAAGVVALVRIAGHARRIADR